MSKPPEPEGDEPFLSRWSRRKRGLDSAAQADATDTGRRNAAGASAVASSKAAAGDGRLEAPAEAEELDLSTLPKVDELDERSDIRAFLDVRVPAALRNAALSRMWSLDPTIRDFIEVAENQWNWNIPGGAPFYEEIEGGMEIAQSIVSGGGSTVQAVADAVGVPDAHNTLVDNAETRAQGSREVDCNGAGDAAPQDEAPAPGDRLTSEDVLATSMLQPVYAGDEPNAAMQQKEPLISEDSLLRRRHGGALPT